jgi:hypothetical protein
MTLPPRPPAVTAPQPSAPGKAFISPFPLEVLTEEHPVATASRHTQSTVNTNLTFIFCLLEHNNYKQQFYIQALLHNANLRASQQVLPNTKKARRFLAAGP